MITKPKPITDFEVILKLIINKIKLFHTSPRSPGDLEVAVTTCPLTRLMYYEAVSNVAFDLYRVL